MKSLIAVVMATSVLLLGAAPSHAATPVPGRFCKSAEVGKKVMTPKYGLVICKKDGERARWKKRSTRSLEVRG